MYKLYKWIETFFKNETFERIITKSSFLPKDMKPKKPFVTVQNEVYLRVCRLI